MHAQGLNSKWAELSVKIIRRLASDGVAFHSWKGDGALALEGRPTVWRDIVSCSNKCELVYNFWQESAKFEEFFGFSTSEVLTRKGGMISFKWRRVSLLINIEESRLWIKCRWCAGSWELSDVMRGILFWLDEHLQLRHEKARALLSVNLLRTICEHIFFLCDDKTWGSISVLSYITAE